MGHPQPLLKKTRRFGGKKWDRALPSRKKKQTSPLNQKPAISPSHIERRKKVNNVLCATQEKGVVRSIGGKKKVSQSLHA